MAEIKGPGIDPHQTIRRSPVCGVTLVRGAWHWTARYETQTFAKGVKIAMAYVRCINNRGYEVSLTAGAIYKVLPTESDAASLRVIDNEGEDYLYDIGRFEPVTYQGELLDASDVVTIHLDPVLKGIVRAEALAAQKSVSALLREWIDERLDLPAEV